MNADKRDALLADVDAFCRDVRPHEELCYVERRFNDQLLPLAKRFGLLGIPIPVEYGGRGADASTYAAALTRIGREGTGVRTFFSGHTSIGQAPILSWGTPDQKQRYLPASVAGDKILAFALTEPDAGSNPLELQTTFERRGDQFLLNGMKYLISNGGIAHAVIAFAYPAGEHDRMSAFIVDMQGDSVSREDLTAKIGMPTANTAMFEFRDHPVPLSNLLGAEGNGFRIAMHTLVSGRLSVAAGCLGVIEDCLAETLDYARQRHQHGKPIGMHQLVQSHIAAIELARVATDAVVARAAAAKAASDDNPNDESLRRAADLLVTEAKVIASRAAWESADHAVQVFGGRGYSTLYRPGRHLQDVRVCRIYEGTEEILHLKIAATLLGKGFDSFR